LPARAFLAGRGARGVGLLAVLAAVLAPGDAAQNRKSGVSRERLNPARLAAPSGYTHVLAVRGGKMVFVSGQVAADEKGNPVGKGDLKAQTTRVFENLRTALLGAGAGLGDIVKMTTYVVNYRAEMLPMLREVRSAFLGDVAVPTSTLVGVQALARPEYLIEIEVIAVVE